MRDDAAKAFLSITSFAAPSLLCATLLAPWLAPGPAAGAIICHPLIRLDDAHISAVDRATMRRTWTTTASIDASKCTAGTSGHFEINFVLLKENAPDVVSSRRFAWRVPSVQATIQLAADESVGAFRVGAIGACACNR